MGCENAGRGVSGAVQMSRWVFSLLFFGPVCLSILIRLGVLNFLFYFCSFPFRDTPHVPLLFLFTQLSMATAFRINLIRAIVFWKRIPSDLIDVWNRRWDGKILGDGRICRLS